MFLIYRDSNESPPDILLLTAEEIRHARARRLSEGDEVLVGDGREKRWSGLYTPDPPGVRIDSGVAPLVVREPELILCTALPEGKRWDWLLQKSTELGLTCLQPLNCERSERRDFSRERAERIFREAGAQAGRFRLPRINDILLPAKLPDAFPDSTRWTVLDPEGEPPATGGEAEPRGASEGDAKRARAAIVGPEGGFSENELNFFQSRGWRAEKLAGGILRVETAGLAALAYFQILERSG